MIYCLQSRWRLEGKRLVYYGLRNKEHLFDNVIRLSEKQARILTGLPGPLTEAQLRILRPLIGKQVVSQEHRKRIPNSLDEATF